MGACSTSDKHKHTYHHTRETTLNHQPTFQHCTEPPKVIRNQISTKTEYDGKFFVK
jgi:hypothetical protein